MRHFIAAVALCAAGLGLAPVASADISCQGALDWRAAHDAQGDNVDTSSQGAVDAYNSEADAIDATVASAC